MPACQIPEPRAGIGLHFPSVYFPLQEPRAQIDYSPKCHVRAECLIRPKAAVCMLGSSTLTFMEMNIRRDVSLDRCEKHRRVVQRVFILLLNLI
ncbi:uncharacterized [Tachysurus ichikawai]